jgi:hypothetical protein
MMTLSRNTLVSLAAAGATADNSVSRMLLDLKSENASMRKQLKTLMETGGPVLTSTPTKRRATDEADESQSRARLASARRPRCTTSAARVAGASTTSSASAARAPSASMHTSATSAAPRATGCTRARSCEAVRPATACNVCAARCLQGTRSLPKGPRWTQWRRRQTSTDEPSSWGLWRGSGG